MKPFRCSSALVGSSTSVLTLQNGVDSADQIARAVGESATIAGATYVATALEAPGLIVQTGTHRRIVFGEVFGDRSRVSPRVASICEAMVSADILAEAVADARSPLWEKFVYLAPFAGFTGAARLPIGPLRQEPAIRRSILEAAREVEQVGRAEGVSLPAELAANLVRYLDALPGRNPFIAAHRPPARQADRGRGAARIRDAARPERRRSDANHVHALRAPETLRTRARPLTGSRYMLTAQRLAPASSCRMSPGQGSLPSLI